METTLTAAQLFVRCLENEGVNYIFGVPGEENLAFLEAVRTSTITFIITRNEQAAVFMAATSGRLTGRTGVALSTLGPGATNLMTGVAYAQLGGMPLLVITGQKPVRASKQGKFQIIDTVAMMTPVTKYAASIPSADRVPSMVREAVRKAESERPGAVHLELPEDIAEEMTDAIPLINEKVRRPIPHEKAVAQAVALLEKAHHPLVIVAAGANRKLIRKQLDNFLQKTQIPFVTTQMGKGVIDETSPLYIGTTALTSGDYVHAAIDAADTIVMLGHDVSEKPPALFNSDKHALIHLNFYPAEIDAVYVPQLEVVGDVSHALWQMAETISVQSHWNFTYFYKCQAALQKNISERSIDARFPLLPERLVADIRSVLPKDGMLSLDNGMYKIWVARNFPATEQNSVLLDNALATMGAGLSAGIAAKLLHPDKKVLVIAGDGGIMMNIAELETARRLELDLVVLVLNDSGFGMISWKQKIMDLPEYALSFTNPDFVQLAESFGGVGHRITSSGEFSSVLQKALDAKGVHLIDCPVDYGENIEALGSLLQTSVEKI